MATPKVVSTTPLSPAPVAVPKKTAARGEYSKTANRRAEILNAAVETFGAGGFRKGSIREIADRVGISEAGLLHHFPSKNSLLFAVLQRRDEISREKFPLDGDHGMTSLLNIVKLTSYNATVPGLIELYCIVSAEATAPDHPAHDYFVERYQNLRKQLVRAFTSLGDNGDLQPGIDPLSAARNLISLMDGLQVLWLLDRTSVVIADEVLRYIQGLLVIDVPVAETVSEAMIVPDVRAMPLHPSVQPIYNEPVALEKLYEDPASGAEHYVVRYSPGMIAERHRHTAAHTIVVVDGKLIANGVVLGPGGYAHFPAGVPMHHAPTLDSGATFVIIFDGPFDVEPLE
ncbi:MAG: TetR/AcrR family transcriptional regulator [Subtercola sp.]|nr:TetR/AcrR family transcriptional regulator [Subtercola sp.]